MDVNNKDLEVFDNSSDDTDNETDGDENSTRSRTPTKKIKPNYPNKFNPLWMKRFTWIRASKQGEIFFFCKCCNVDLIGGIVAIKRHENTIKHKKKFNALAIQPSVLSMNVTSNTTVVNKSKEMELRAALFLVEHNISFNTADHLEGLLKECAKYPDAVKNMSLKRTKCTALINNVLGDSSLAELITKLQLNKFSIIIDESTDNSTTKHLAIIVRFVENLVTYDHFLGLIPIAEANANNIYSAIGNLFKKYNVDYKNQMIGLAADGASTMMGVNHSVQTLFKNDIPNLYICKCICHSLALCSSYACLKLPRVVEDLVRDIYSYFKVSFKRQEKYKEFQSFVEVKPHKLLQLSQTRWLSLLSVIKRVIEQYQALKLFFDSERLVDRIQASQTIYERLRNPFNLCYLEFLEYVLPLVVNLNMEFQAETPKVHLLYARMSTLFKTILEFFIKPCYLKNVDLANIDFKNRDLFVKDEDLFLGPKVMAKFETNNFSEGDKTKFRERCLEFYIELSSQIYKRFPFSSQHVQDLKELDFLEPSNIPNITSIWRVQKISFLKCFIDDINEIDREWRLLRNSEICNNLSDITVTDFWRKVKNMEKGDESLMFPRLVNLVTIVLTLPHSSACVERLFSQINLNKTKIRNRLSSNTLSGILLV